MFNGRDLHVHMTETIRVFLAVDHAFTREGIIAACATLPWITLIGSAQTGDEARRRIPALRPDVVVHHALLPEGQSPRFLADLYGDHRPWRCVMLVPLKDADTAAHALAAQADAFLLTNDLPQHILRTIQTVAQGERFTCPLLAASVAYRHSGTLPDVVARMDGPDREVFHSISNNMTKAAIARRLGLSPTDIGTRRIRLCEALHAMPPADDGATDDRTAAEGVPARDAHAMKDLHPDDPFPGDADASYVGG